jgi:hypothetical protein
MLHSSRETSPDQEIEHEVVSFKIDVNRRIAVVQGTSAVYKCKRMDSHRASAGVKGMSSGGWVALS